ncbi:aromatic ring-hydroxylating dioxygenase subunit alpha [Pelagibius sp. CAU 1746]|uniref:aromatic ring-hydroxylating dioxygenase subunit alpha n=1 Tax=Pelagibius sp. CAU 1746 TaxID=3140370 RepID=UPI00325A78C3
MTFVRNAWYVAGWSKNFGRQLTPLTIMDEDIVVYRTETGQAVALTDECPHKRLPLSRGRLKGDAVECGYHGMTFGCDGKCVRIPGQSNLPSSAWVRAYPLHERHGILWIWMGDAEKADVSRVFDMPEFTDPKWMPHHGDALELECNYLPVADNLCDPAHVSFVHPTTLGNAACEDVPIDCAREGRMVTTWRWIRDAPPVGFFKAFGNFAGNVDRWHYYYLHAPNVAVIDFGSAATEEAIGEAERDRGLRLFALHFLTPVSETRTVDHWMHLRNIALDDEEMGERMNEQFRIAFAEDKAILEAIQAREAKPPARRPLRIAIDRGPNHLRRIIAEMAAQERALSEDEEAMQAVS